MTYPPKQSVILEGTSTLTDEPVLKSAGPASEMERVELQYSTETHGRWWGETAADFCVSYPPSLVLENPSCGVGEVKGVPNWHFTGGL